MGHKGFAGLAPGAMPVQTLRRDQKAAIIVRLLGAEPDGLSLDGLETGNLAQLVRATAGLSHIGEATILATITEFLQDIDSLDLYFRPGLDAAMTDMHPHLNDEVAAVLKSGAPPASPSDPWIGISRTDALTLAPILQCETPQVCAIALAKLSAARAAEILAECEPEFARAVTMAATKASRIGPHTVAAIGQAIADAIEAAGNKGAIAGDPVERVGAILNFAASATREDMLASIRATNPELAETLRRIMFTFSDIPDRVETTDVAKLVRAVENSVLVTALAGGAKSESDTVEFLLANLSKRLAEQLNEEIRDRGEVKEKEADAAMNAVVQGIRDLETAGSLTLITPEG